MAFGTELHLEPKTAGSIRGIQCEVACGCWFTSKGRGIPKMLKYQSSSGEIKEIREIQVHYEEEKNYDGIPSVEYDCEVAVDGKRKHLKLVFFKETCKWVVRIAE